MAHSCTNSCTQTRRILVSSLGSTVRLGQSSHEATSYITKNSTFVSHILKEHGPETGGEGDENVCGSSYTCNLTEYSIDS